MQIGISKQTIVCYSLQASAYLQCCTADFMSPQEQVCGRNLTDYFPPEVIDQLPPEFATTISDVSKVLLMDIV